MRRIYHLSTCSTNKRILSQINTNGVELINIKSQHISEEDLDFMYKHTGSYEALFNKKAQKYKAMPASEKPVKDEDYKGLILSDYTFLKRPAAILDDQVIAGSTPESVNKLIQILKA